MLKKTGERLIRSMCLIAKRTKGSSEGQVFIADRSVKSLAEQYIGE